ncbi:hypothetical protein CDD81_7804 [Ophiocordyceps australis]|uniref:Peptidase M43 pregnancy-associated plasma-A domain-containing protein n=1 Tax=Ophiocordyceps australis TaxID=1399860 RepID=A0A2C5YH36_9HYPO|nr:hypothetical protein CDD81_7804 [Ophiocordyceps australis]
MKLFFLSTVLFAATALSAIHLDNPNCVDDASTREIYASHEKLVAWERNHTISKAHIRIDTHMHVILESETAYNLTMNDLNSQLKRLNDDFRASNISFELRGVNWLTDAIFASGSVNDEMKQLLHEGDSRTLNIYWTKDVDLNYLLLGASTFPNELRNPGGPLADGVIMSKSVKSHELTHEVGHWFGLLHTFEDICNDDGDYIEDTPPSPQSCHDSQLTCPGPSFMSYWKERTLFTPGQMTRMRSFWQEYRASNSNTTTCADAKLTPIKPVERRDRHPFYPESQDKQLAFKQCRLKSDGSVEEKRESYCGSEVFCRWGTYKAAGENYSSPTTCLETRQGNPWVQGEQLDDRNEAEYCVSQRTVFRAFDEDELVKDGQVNDELVKVNGKYHSSTECLEAHDAPPEASLARDSAHFTFS